MSERYTKGNRGFMESLKEDWDELIMNDPELKYIDDEIKSKNCIHARRYKGDIRCAFDWGTCERFTCPNYRPIDKLVKNIGN